MDLNSNPNSYWASLFVEELAQQGLSAVCLAPGSRSTPLALAFAANPSIRVYRHLDERSAAFFALGMALALGRPVALVCTSGTAAANFHPAIIEAYYSRVPLLVLTADRPAELRHSGANQTIDQVKMYGDHVRWAVDAPTPQADPPAVVLRHMRTLAARAYATANGIVKGPVHINFPFRKPLEPDASANGEMPAPVMSTVSPLPYTAMARGVLQPREEQIDAAAKLIAAHPNGLILCGPDHPSSSFATAVAALALRGGYPILADTLSNLRHGPHVRQGLVTGGYHAWLGHLKDEHPRPDVVLRFGAVPTSSVLAAYLSEVSPAHHWHIREDGEWADDLHHTHTFLQCDPTLFCEQVAERLAGHHIPEPSTWAAPILRLESETWSALEKSLGKAPFFDGAAVSQLLSRLPDDTVLFAGNSLPVRHVDMYDRPSDQRLMIYGNRGASGIDGNVSTALGLAAALNKRVVALLGDITFYHDMNGLLAVRQHQLKRVVFVVINNDGGGIFRRLPIAGHEPPFIDLFLTPHGLTFEHTAAMYGLQYCPVECMDAFDTVLNEVFANDTGPYLIEIKSDSTADLQQQRRVAAEVAASYRQIISTNS
jgi:2-succinyl-5-enolpyruvyl-6-hydroxy-3-cyclohexene-1-carboxylate synthase